MEDFIKARNLILDSVKRELIGPGSEDIGGDIAKEVITDRPTERYSAGILFPKDIKENRDIDSDIEENDYTDSIVLEDYKDFAENEEISKLKKDIFNESNIKNISDFKKEKDLSIDEKISMTNEMKQSAMGFTFFVRGDAKHLNVRIKGAKYRPCKLSDCHVKYLGEDTFIGTELEEYVYRSEEFIKLSKKLTAREVTDFSKDEKIKDDIKMKNILYTLANQLRRGYIRYEIELPESITIDVDGKKDFINKPIKLIDKNNNYIDTGIDISVMKRSYDENIKSYTIVMSNNLVADFSNIDLKAIFQPEILVSSEDNPSIQFIETRDGSISNGISHMDDEEKSMELLYLNKKNYAIGHGVSVDYDIDSNTNRGIIKTNFLPTEEVPKLKFRVDELNDSEYILSMKNLSDISSITKDQKIKNLNEIVDVYKQWIDNLSLEIQNIDIRLRERANDHITKCEKAYKRIKKGVELIEKKQDVYISFSLMNRAMLMQRVHSDVKERVPNDEKVNFPEFDYENLGEKEGKWRPFQIAYILMCIESIYNPECSDRDIVDLIWVPTGGGKTEAYLGLSAFTIFLRRLRYTDKSSGTTILMRYTLRLLTAQQFIRASIMICACEKIRKEKKYNLGHDEISIGLWIGNTQTPNTKSEARDAFEELSKDGSKENKFQLLQCPWCGTKLEKDPKNRNTRWGYRFTERASEIRCTERKCEFSRGLPVQVVDECLYEKPPTLLFSTVDKFAMIPKLEEVGNLFGLDNNNLSPELIIQDELHLISGPLGTMVGLYETAVDAMCSYKGVRPKIIASTATIKRAEEQCKQLYCREVSQFPPSGIYIEDSFFIREDEENPGRLYVGVMPNGKTVTTTNVRLVSTLTNKLKMMDISESIKSEYWTLVSYFNTLKDVGKSVTLIPDDIQDNILRVSSRIGRRNEARKLINIRELTSRRTSSEINKTLKDLNIEYSKESIKNKKYPVDVVLASNMISVGLDVSRLNLMLIVQQPKSTAEYIQASSRVGRKNPGIVFTLYNPSRSRDRSHYEKFCDYHKSFYKYVEPTSVTPFSEPARQRGLHSVLISMVRHMLKISLEEDASQFDIYMEGIEDIKDFILDRVNKLDETSDKSMLKEVEFELDSILYDWDDKVKYAEENNKKMRYSRPYKEKFEKDATTISLMKGFYESGSGYSTLTSMRNVSPNSKVEILTFGGDNNEK
ncbi:helicase-related protein [Paraclostridium bifermentans]